MNNNSCMHQVMKHRSFLLRPLKDVDMKLQYNKVTNLRLAISKINSVVIEPGQLFSIWKLVGRPTSSKGYLDGLVLHNGQISKGCGGGLCQLGNLLYWIALHSELDVVERWRHGFDVFPDINRTIPFACGATLSYNYIDLLLKNNTQNTYHIHLWLDKEYLNGELLADSPSKYKFEVYETDHLIKQQWWGGYTRHNKIWKKRIEISNNETTDELVTENPQVSEQINRARKVLVCYLCNCKHNQFHPNLFYAHENKNRKKVRESHLQTNIRFDSSIHSQEIYLRP